MFSYLVEVIFACFLQILFLGILDIPLCTCLPSSPLLFLFLELKKKKNPLKVFVLPEVLSCARSSYLAAVKISRSVFLFVL